MCSAAKLIQWSLTLSYVYINGVSNPRQIGDDIWVFTSALYATTTTVVRSSSAILVVDPNWSPDEVRFIRTFVDKIRGTRELHILFTHSDYDHILGYGAFDPDHVIASKAFVQNPERSLDVEEAIATDRGYGFTRDYPLTYPEADVIISRDGQQVSAADMTLTCYLAPGHTPEGMFTVLEQQRVLIAGDYLSDIEFPLVNDLQAYRSTLSKLEDIIQHHDVGIMIPGHGSVATSPDDILRRRNAAGQYLDDLLATLRGIPFPEGRYQARYQAWDSLQEWHQQNLKSVRRG